MKLQASAEEPAERVVSVELSKAELVALVKWHCSQARKIPSRLGRVVIELQAKSPFGGGRALKELHTFAREQLEAHTTRAKNLAKLLEGKKG